LLANHPVLAHARASQAAQKVEIESLRAKLRSTEDLAERQRTEAEAALAEARAGADALRAELQAATDGAARAAAEGAALRAVAKEREAAHAATTLALQQEACALRAKVGSLHARTVRIRPGAAPRRSVVLACGLACFGEGGGGHRIAAAASASLSMLALFFLGRG
jgi:hypothetical protein